MSHIVSINVEFKDIQALRSAVVECGGEWLGLGTGTHRMFTGEVFGVGFKLKAWVYPCVLDKGKLHYDNFNGCWGDDARLSELKRIYARNVAIKQAARVGFRLMSQSVKADGSIVLKVGRS